MPISEQIVHLEQSSLDNIYSDSSNDTKALLKLIKESKSNNPRPFGNLLSRTFYLSKNTLEDSKNRYVISPDRTSIYGTRITKRPTLEVLLLDHPDKLLDIIDALIEKNSEEFFKAFVTISNMFGLSNLRPAEEAKLYIDKSTQRSDMLFTWNDAMKDQLRASLDEMPSHIQKLLHEHNTTSNKRAVTLSNQYLDLLIPLIDEQKNSASEASQTAAIPLRQHFINLRSKLRFAVRLHKDDKAFAEHRGSRWYLAPIGNVLFGLVGLATLGIALKACHALTSRYSSSGARYFLFSTKTTSAARNDKMHTTLGLSSEMHFDNKDKDGQDAPTRTQDIKIPWPF